MTRGWSLYLWDNPWQLWGDINFREDSDALDWPTGTLTSLFLLDADIKQELFLLLDLQLSGVWWLLLAVIWCCLMCRTILKAWPLWYSHWMQKSDGAKLKLQAIVSSFNNSFCLVWHELPWSQLCLSFTIDIWVHSGSGPGLWHPGAHLLCHLGTSHIICRLVSPA